MRDQTISPTTPASATARTTATGEGEQATTAMAVDGPHPAVLAWSELRPDNIEPTAIETLKKAKSKSAVYRLAGVGRDGTAVVAKRCRWAVATVEHALYDRVLSKLPLPALHYYGFVPESDRVYGWLFVEDAGDVKYDPTLREHRCLAARWLATLHTSARDLISGVELPERGPEFYLEQARGVRRAIVESRANPVLQSDDREVLARIDAHLEVIESNREEILGICQCMPSTLVHGDFVGKNIRLRATHDGRDTRFYALDWETSGWGVPAADLCRFVGMPAMPDLQTYCSALRDHGWTADPAKIEELAALGGVFRMVSAMYWASLRLSHPWVGKCMIWMRSYHDDMEPALNATRWGRSLAV